MVIYYQIYQMIMEQQPKITLYGHLELKHNVILKMVLKLNQLILHMVYQEDLQHKILKTWILNHLIIQFLYLK